MWNWFAGMTKLFSTGSCSTRDLCISRRLIVCPGGGQMALSGPFCCTVVQWNFSITGCTERCTTTFSTLATTPTTTRLSPPNQSLVRFHCLKPSTSIHQLTITLCSGLDIQYLWPKLCISVLSWLEIISTSLKSLFRYEFEQLCMQSWKLCFHSLHFGWNSIYLCNHKLNTSSIFILLSWIMCM